MAEKWLANQNWLGTRADQHTGYLPKGGPKHELNIWDNIKTILGLQASKYEPINNIGQITVAGKNQVNKGDTVNKIGEIKVTGKDLSKNKNNPTNTVPKTSTSKTINKPPVVNKPATKVDDSKTKKQVPTTNTKTTTEPKKSTRTELVQKWGNDIVKKTNEEGVQKEVQSKLKTARESVPVPTNTGKYSPEITAQLKEFIRQKTEVPTEEFYARQLENDREAKAGITTRTMQSLPMFYGSNTGIQVNTLGNMNSKVISNRDARKYLKEGGKFVNDLIQEFKKGGGIHIKPENKGKFTATKKKTGKTTEELTHSKNPVTKKRAIFAQNAKKWKHKDGGVINFDISDILKTWKK